MIRNFILIFSILLQSIAFGQEFTKTQLPYIPKNFITNSGVESGITGFITYNEGDVASPVDGTGGTPTVTISSSTTNPISGGRSLLFTKPTGSSHRGQGFSVKEITLDNASKGKVIRTKLDYEVVSGTYASGDMTIWIYDITNARLIQPSSYSIENSALKETKFLEWQSSIDSVSYRLIVHVTSTSTQAYSLRFDSFETGLGSKVYGSVATDWELVTSGASLSWTNSNLTLYKRRVGNSVEYQGRITFSNTPVGSALTLTLPHSYESRVVSTGYYYNSGYLVDSSANQDYSLFGGPTGANQFTFYRLGNSPPNMGSYGSVSPTTPVTIASGDAITFSISPMPVVGWSSSQQLSQDASTRVVAASSNFKLATGTLNGSYNLIKIPAGTVDTHGTYNASTGEYTIPVPGLYDINLYVETAFGAASDFAGVSVGIYKNGSPIELYGNNYIARNIAGNITATKNGILSLVAGDKVSFFAQSGAVAPTFSNTATGSGFNIKMLSGPSQIAASESVSARYTQTSGQSIANVDVVIVNYANKIWDSHGAVTTGASWKFTAPMAGEYRFCYGVEYASASFTQGNSLLSYFFKQGVEYSAPPGFIVPVTGTNSWSPYPICSTLKLLSGEYADLRLYQNSGGARSLSTSASRNYIEVNRVGNY